MANPYENDFCRRLGLRLPVVQGPFGGGLSTVKLTSTVSNGGGLGSLGAHHLAPGAISETVAQIRGATSGAFAINLWVSNEDERASAFDRAAYDDACREFEIIFEKLGVAPPEFPPAAPLNFEEQAEALLEARPPVFSFVFGIPSRRILDACRSRGIVTVGAATTLDEARAWEAAGVDAVLATGCEAGGHRPSFLKPAELSLVGTFPLVRQVAAAVRLPVIAAGGIADGAGVKAALALGAQAAQVGTAFLACEESGTTATHRGALFSPPAGDTVLSRGFSGRLARFIRNDYLERFERRELTPLPYPVHGWFVDKLKQAAAERGDWENMALYAGQGAPLLKRRRASELLRDFEEALAIA